MTGIEIQVVKNGYTVRRPRDFSGGVELVSDVLVFESFENLVKWMQSELAKPKGTSQ